MGNRKMVITGVLLYGGLWGLLEATVGYGLHLLPSGFSGMIMFPIGFYCMYNAYKISHHRSAIFYTAIIAASIKLIDLFLPAHSPMSVINPAVSILLESLVVVGFVSIYKEIRHYRHALMASFAWIVLFVVTQQFLVKPGTGLYLYSTPVLIGLIGMNTIISGALIGMYLKVPQKLTFNIQRYQFSYVQSLAVLFIAAIFEAGNSLL